MRHAEKRRLTAQAFTLVELMIVVVIVAILALCATTLLYGHVKRSKMSEGISCAGTIRTAFRVYSSYHNGAYPTLSAASGNGLSAIGITSADLTGKYFTAASYAVSSAADSYTIRATLPTDETYWYQIDEDGNETMSDNF